MQESQRGEGDSEVSMLLIEKEEATRRVIRGFGAKRKGWKGVQPSGL